jgi:Dolichyl-phosphate-mannose-protein mannosyltransferase
MLAITLLAFAVQLYRLDARTFHGDELGSLAESMHIGQNPNGIVYFVFMHYWALLGISEFWLRVPSAFLAVVSISVNYVLGTTLINRHVGTMLAALLATAPFSLEYGQQFRFYSLFLFAAGLTYLAFVRYAQLQTRVRLITLLLANALILGAHFFGTLVASHEIMMAVILTRRLSYKFKWIALSIIILLSVFLLFSPPTQAFFYGWMSRLTNPYDDPTYVAAKGLSPANLAKVPLTFFFFLFGEHVYPLDITLVLPGLFIVVIAGLLGLRKILFLPSIGWLIVLSLFIFPPLLFLIFDPLSSQALQGAAPRYLIFLLPLFYLVVAAGAQDRSWLIAALLLMNGASLASYWYGDWAYTDDLINWREVTRRAEPYVTAQTLMLLDGRSRGQADYYFPAGWPVADAGSYQSPERIAELQGFARLIVVSYDFHQESRAYATALLEAVGKDFRLSFGWSQYPLFVYVYDRNADGLSADAAVAGQRVVSLPAEIYGLEFQDVRLPLTLRLNETTWQSASMFSLPSLTKQDSRMLRTACPAPAQHLWLFSNLTAGSALRVGEPVAELVVRGGQGESQMLPIRLAYETANWDGQCQPNACRPAYRWPKRLALLGSEAYPGSWQEFDAAIFAAEVDLSHPMGVCTIEVRRTTPQAVFHVWGLALER